MVKVDWATSAAKVVIMSDLKDKVLPAHASVMSAKEAWEKVYMHLVEFHGVDYEQFRENLNNHRRAYRKKREQVAWAKNAIAHDLELHPRKSHNHCGELVFAFSEAKKKLKKDVERRKHKTMKPIDLRNTRPEYKVFTLDKFRQRIYQQERREKFENYLEDKRDEKAKERQAHLQNRNKPGFPKRRRRK